MILQMPMTVGLFIPFLLLVVFRREIFSGKIVPSLFWRDGNDFLEKGKGYCITCDDDIASWAFSAAVSTKETDIGIETDCKYQQQGLGLIVTKK